MNVAKLREVLAPLDGDLPVTVAVPGPVREDSAVVAFFTYPAGTTWVKPNPDDPSEMPHGVTILGREVF